MASITSPYCAWSKPCDAYKWTASPVCGGISTLTQNWDNCYLSIIFSRLGHFVYTHCFIRSFINLSSLRGTFIMAICGGPGLPQSVSRCSAKKEWWNLINRSISQLVTQAVRQTAGRSFISDFYRSSAQATSCTFTSLTWYLPSV